MFGSLFQILQKNLTFRYELHMYSNATLLISLVQCHDWLDIQAAHAIRTGCSLNIVFFPRILESLPPLPRQHSAAIGCTKNVQPIGGTVHSHCVENCEKNTIFSEHPVSIYISSCLSFFLTLSPVYLDGCALSVEVCKVDKVAVVDGHTIKLLGVDPLLLLDVPEGED